MGSVQMIQIRGKRVQTKSLGKFEAVVLVAPRSLFSYLSRARRSLFGRVTAEMLYRRRSSLYRLCRCHERLSRQGLHGSFGRWRNRFGAPCLSRRRLEKPLFCSDRRRLGSGRGIISRTAEKTRETENTQNEPQRCRRPAAPLGPEIFGRTEITKSAAREKSPLRPFYPLATVAAIFWPIEHSHFLRSRHRVARSISQTAQ